MDVKTGGGLEASYTKRDIRPEETDEVREARRRPHVFVPSWHRFCGECGLSPSYPIHSTRWQVFKRPRRRKAAAS